MSEGWVGLDKSLRLWLVFTPITKQFLLFAIAVALLHKIVNGKSYSTVILHCKKKIKKTEVPSLDE